MASKKSSTQARPVASIETVDLLAPGHNGAASIATSFGLDPVDFEGIMATVRSGMDSLATALPTDMDDRATDILFQRLAGAYVGAAFGAGNFYSSRIGQARQATARLTNDHRNEDREPVYGFESRVDRLRDTAARAGLQAYALRAAAHGAVTAYSAITGNEWKPYVSQTDQKPVSQKAREAQMTAFDTRD